MLIKLPLFFIVGVVECFGQCLNIKFIQRSKYLLSFISAFINILIWAFVLSAIVENIHESYLVIISYAFGYALGDVCAIKFDGYLEKLAKLRGFKLRKKKRKCQRMRKKK